MTQRPRPSDDVPPGLRENPTAWSTRLPLAALAFVGLAVASYLTLYQIDVISTVWDPFFRHGSPQVLDLTSPVPDAAVGVLAYASEVVLSFIGGADRWRTMPWTALAFGAVVLAGALVSVALIVIQPTVVGAWCTPCLASAAISFTLFAFGFKEALAAGQHVRRVAASGGSPWHALWGQSTQARPVSTRTALERPWSGTGRPRS